MIKKVPICMYVCINEIKSLITVRANLTCIFKMENHTNLTNKIQRSCHLTVPSRQAHTTHNMYLANFVQFLLIILQRCARKHSATPCKSSQKSRECQRAFTNGRGCCIGKCLWLYSLDLKCPIWLRGNSKDSFISWPRYSQKHWA